MSAYAILAVRRATQTVSRRKGGRRSHKFCSNRSTSHVLRSGKGQFRPCFIVDMQPTLLPLVEKHWRWWVYILGGAIFPVVDALKARLVNRIQLSD
jgi:hypothetical protein